LVKPMGYSKDLEQNLMEETLKMKNAKEGSII
jgi:hypothetical protein